MAVPLGLSHYADLAWPASDPRRLHKPRDEQCRDTPPQSPEVTRYIDDVLIWPHSQREVGFSVPSVLGWWGVSQHYETREEFLSGPFEALIGPASFGFLRRMSRGGEREPIDFFGEAFSTFRQRAAFQEVVRRVAEDPQAADTFYKRVMHLGPQGDPRFGVEVLSAALSRSPRVAFLLLRASQEFPLLKPYVENVLRGNSFEEFRRLATTDHHYLSFLLDLYETYHDPILTEALRTLNLDVSVYRNHPYLLLRAALAPVSAANAYFRSENGRAYMMRFMAEGLQRERLGQLLHLTDPLFYRFIVDLAYHDFGQLSTGAAAVARELPISDLTGVAPETVPHLFKIWALGNRSVENSLRGLDLANWARTALSGIGSSSRASDVARALGLMRLLGNERAGEVLRSQLAHHPEMLFVLGFFARHGSISDVDFLRDHSNFYPWYLQAGAHPQGRVSGERLLRERFEYLSREFDNQVANDQLQSLRASQGAEIVSGSADSLFHEVTVLFPDLMQALREDYEWDAMPRGRQHDILSGVLSRLMDRMQWFSFGQYYQYEVTRSPIVGYPLRTSFGPSPLALFEARISPRRDYSAPSVPSTRVVTPHGGRVGPGEDGPEERAREEQERRESERPSGVLERALGAGSDILRNPLEAVRGGPHR